MAAPAELIPAGEVIACHTVDDWNNKFKAAKESNKLVPFFPPDLGFFFYSKLFYRLILVYIVGFRTSVFNI